MQRHEAPTILIVEDDPIMGESLVERLSLEGYRPVWLTTGGEALGALQGQRPDLLVCDIRLPDMTGEELYHSLLPQLGGTPVVFMTGFGDVSQAVRLVRAGADDYLTKPFAVDEFLTRIGDLLRSRGIGTGAAEAVLGTSPAIRQVEQLLRRVADVDSTLLITGESGVGKEVAANFVHRISQRAEAPFMAVNCAAIPQELIDSEVFGHEKGAFTGAHALHRGYAERAGNGVLLLDEVGELPLPVQVKLLRLIQERLFFRVGGEKPLPFAARLVCATNADLEQRVREGAFRRDLFYRLNVIPVTIPSLRDRLDDVLPLLQAYLRQYADAFGRPAQRLTPQAEAVALTHDWPGNVRELRNRIERAVALATGPWIGANDLFPESVADDQFGTDTDWPQLTAVRDESERSYILATLRRADGQLGKAADLLGVGRTTLWEKMRRLGIAMDQME
ncbi:sigma-54-dependent Fis family transcriptional regulator [Azospirillum sp. YIM DDC1]|uniref:Sigma-54-dependent Fis family transcriptional regulator n=1 Tax=Azospirillum aestuarii TaxID=2802052 RepID=A0ABS1HTD8_9PROT|nr:sigma-54 dependent transcriptional regulator [Azospirillum aestuarii]MBK4717662.1 sigma-54-dependent Fis family transcriptional regulator [Azospirillum aestuarii]